MLMNMLTSNLNAQLVDVLVLQNLNRLAWYFSRISLVKGTMWSAYLACAKHGPEPPVSRLKIASEPSWPAHPLFRLLIPGPRWPFHVECHDISAQTCQHIIRFGDITCIGDFRRIRKVLIAEQR
jgi:hypothetical protein